MKAKQLRLFAKNQMKGSYGRCFYVSLLFTALSSVANLIPFGSLLFGGALSVGLTAFYLNLSRNAKSDVKLIFSSFTGNIANIFVMELFQALFLFLWALVPFVGGIIVIVKTYSYAMAPYILVDNPEMNGRDVITASRQMMKGKKFKLFCLELSYLGWNILVVLTFGLLNIMVAPRIAVARAAFYDSIKGGDTAVTPEPVLAAE